MFRFLLIVATTSLLPTAALASPTEETRENAFLDLVDSQGNVLVQGQGVDDVNATPEQKA